MAVNRRDFLSTLACAGAVAALAPSAALAGLSAAPATPALSSPLPFLLLRMRGNDDERFVAAFRASADALGRSVEQTWMSAELLRRPAALRRHFAEFAGSRVAGLLADPACLVLEEVVCELGGSIISRGVHVADRLGASRHDFQSTPACAGIGRYLASAAAMRQGTVLVNETLLGAERGDAPFRASPPMDWEAALGGACARIAGGTWQATRVAPSTGMPRLMAMQAVAVATSYVFEI